ncbi:MAG: hypothetical protein A2Y00_02685 [Omnitrophica WOR_2 bacterium GWF2_43_52]|nr:MAG: hypothetical protein A2Y00_02685 [Omnitrophica WOR_2 bacterium GWF2_43_52]OGX56356.1 MAG: hypothetical protein A2460_03315 [Omnitrophica WOR_2 bacterium RIFOXYC2_FULL_43_9]
MDKKKRFNACLSILITSLLVISSTTTFAQEKKPIRVVVFGWDGTQRSDLIDILQDETDRSSEQWQDINITTAEQLYEAAVQNLQGKLLADSSFLIKKDLPKKDFLPTLRKIIEQGRIVKIHISENTATKPGWTQILTGYNADITGVYKNTPGYYTAFPRGYSIFGRLADTFGPDNIYNIMVTGKDKHIGTKELSANNILPFYNEVIVDKKKNYYNYLDYQATDRQRMPDEVYAEAENALNEYAKVKNQNLFAFIHFCWPDGIGHQYGEGTEEYRLAIEVVDYYTGKIIEKMKALGIYNGTSIYITSDHGFDKQGARYPYKRYNSDDEKLEAEEEVNDGREGDHYGAPHTFLATNDPAVVRGGNRRDIAPTILRKFKIDLTTVKPKLSGIPLTKYNFPKDISDVNKEDQQLLEENLPYTGADNSLGPKEIKRMLLVSWSGANRTRIKELLQKGELPNLKKLIQEGNLLDIDSTSVMIDELAAEPLAGMSCLLSGYEADLTGVYDHAKIAASLPEGYTVFERLEKFFKNKTDESGIATAAIIGKDDIKDFSNKGIEYMFGKSKKNIDTFIIEETAKITGKTLNFLNECENNKLKVFAFVHYSYPDLAGHQYGENSPEYREAIKRCDKELGELMRLFESKEKYDNTLFYVSATNGFENGDLPRKGKAILEYGDLGKSHFLGSYVFLATNDSRLKRHGLQIDIVPTILRRWGMGVNQIYPVLPGKVLSQTMDNWVREYE